MILLKVKTSKIKFRAEIVQEYINGQKVYLKKLYIDLPKISIVLLHVYII